MGKIFTNDNQLQEWVDASKMIRKGFGIEKALGYLIGGKFYDLVSLLHDARKAVRGMDEIYERDLVRITKAEKLLPEFVGLIKGTFESHEIQIYLQSHPRLVAYMHVANKEQYDLIGSKVAIEHSIDTEIEDALILGDMLKYFGIGC